LPQPIALADYLAATRLLANQDAAPQPVEEMGTDLYAPALNNRAVWAADRLTSAQLTKAFQQAADLGTPQAAVQFNLGVAAWQAGDLALAQEALSRAALLDPSWDRPPVFLATLLLTVEPAQPAAAEAAARRAVALSPGDRAGHLALVHALWRQGKVDDGLAAVTAARERFAQDAQLALYHGLFLRAAGDKPAALDVLRSAFFAAEDQSLRRRIAEEVLSVL
jgi:tetratricopeptide (TPR) repeat protein